MNNQDEIFRIACENALYMLGHAGMVQYSTAIDEAQFKARPSTRYRPALTLDGVSWCALYGENLQEGVAGFGNSPEKAMEDFDRVWIEARP